MSRALLAACAVVTLLGVAPSARAADAAEQRLAEALFDEARALMEQKRFTEACPKLVESQRLDPGTGTLLNLAVCHEGEGRLATAATEYREVIAISTRENRADRRVVAEERLEAIEPLVPRLAVTVSPRAQALRDLEVTVDGLELRAAAWGVPAAVDPGNHVVTVRSSEHPGWTFTVTIDRSETRTVEVDPPATDWAPPAGPARELPPPVPARTTKHNPVHTTLLVTAAAGYAGFAVFGLLSLDARSTAKEGCIPERDFCFTPAGRDAASNRSTFAWVSTISLAAAVGATIGFVLVPTRVSTTKSASTTRIGVGPGSLVVGGTF